MKKKLLFAFLVVVVCMFSLQIYGAQKKILVWNNDRGECEQQYPDIARWDDALTVVAWQDKRVGDYDIWGQFVDKEGSLLDKNFRINKTQPSKAQQNVSISCMKSQDWFVAVWQTNLYDEGDIYGQIFDRTGHPLSELYRINEVNEGIQINPRVEVSTNGYFAVCWQSDKSGDWDIQAKGFSFIDHTFKEESPEYTVNRKTEYNQINPDLDIYPSLGKASDVVCYVWEDSRMGQWDIFLRRFYITGEPLDLADTLVCDKDLQSESMNPAISTNKNGSMLIAWEDDRPRRALFTVFYQVIDDKLNFLGSNKPVTGSATEYQLGASVAATESNIGTIAWHDKRNGNYDIYGQLIDLQEGALIGSNFPVNGSDSNDEWYCAIDRDGGDSYHSVTWMDNRNPEGIWDIFFRSLDKDGQPLTEEIEVSKLFGVTSTYDDDEDYDDPETPTWNEDPITDPVYTYESAKAVVDMMEENNIDNLWQITESETLPSRERLLLDEYAATVVDLGWRHGGLSSAGSMTATERSDLTSYITAGNPVLIMGNDFGYQYSGDPLYDKFRITYKGDGNPWTTGNIKTLYGKDDRFTKGMQFSFRYQDTCDNYVDRIDVAGADTIFYSDGPAKVYYMRGSAWSFAWKADAYTSHLTFSLDGLISDEHPNTNIELMRRMMAFLRQRVAPEPITTLRANSTATEGLVNLTWTAPLNQKADGADAASGYILKFTHYENVSPSYGKMTTDAEFNAANTYYQEWTPQTGGSSEDMTITGLPPCDTLIFAMKAYDNYNDTLRHSTLGDEPKVVVPGDRVTPHTIVIGQNGGYVKDFIISEMMDVRTGTIGGSDTLFFTWDGSNMYVGYARCNWSTQGDMLLYFDFESGGADITFPLNSGARNVLPQDFHADYCFCVLDYSSRRLFQDNGLGDWNKTSISYTGSFSEDDIVNSREYTEFSIPFGDMSYNRSNALKLIVTCQDETDNDIWNAFPIENGLGKTHNLDYYYYFDSLGMGVSPRDTVKVLEITLTSFTAISRIDGIELNWRVESESEIYQWIIERKEDAGYSEIGRIDISGNSQSPTEHSFIDRDVLRENTYTYRLIVLDNAGHKSCLGTIEVEFSPPYSKNPHLYAVCPNPVRGISQIQFSIPERAFVTLRVYNIRGSIVETIVNAEKKPGVYCVSWPLKNVIQGIYFVELQCGASRTLRKVTLLR